MFVVAMYSIYAEDFMVRDVKYIYPKMSYEQVKQLLVENRNLHRFPLVDNTNSMVLLGSIQRLQLVGLIEMQVGRERRWLEAAKRMRNVQEKAKQTILNLENETSKQNSEVLVVRTPSTLSIAQVRRLITKERLRFQLLEAGEVFDDVHE